MSRATSDDQLKFLLSCVRHSNNGKIDFVEVAEECGVVSKGAAAKRYERLLKANGIHPSGGPPERLPPSTPKQKSRNEIARAAAAKRRKIEDDTFQYRNDDEDDFKPYLKTESSDIPRIKAEPNTEFELYPHQHFAAPFRPPFFPRPPVPPMQMNKPYMPQYNSIHPHSQAHVSTMPPRMVHPATQASQQVVRPQTSIPGSESPVVATPHLQPTTAGVPEEHITSMFEEFCSQDMFKMPVFDNPSSDQATLSSGQISSTLTEQALAPAADPEISPRTPSVVAIPIAEPEARNMLIPPKTEPNIVEPFLAHIAHVEAEELEPRPQKAAETPLGTGFDDCILIAD